MPSQAPFDDKGRKETDPEFHQRMQDTMDNDSWVGRDTVGDEFPQRGVVHEYESGDDTPHIYRRKR